MAKERSAISKDDKWNVESLYPNFTAWQKEFDAVCREKSQPHWPKIAAFQGKLHQGPEQIKELFDQTFLLERKLTKLYTYAHLRHDEDITEDVAKKAYARISAILHDFQKETSWIDPELLSLPQATIKKYLKSKVLADYRFHLEKILRVKPHTLSQEQEGLLALAGKALQAPQRAFSAISDADFKFGTVLDSRKKKHELTHAQYGNMIRHHDRTLRKNAFTQLLKAYGDYENTLCELVNGQVQGHLFHARARNYNSCLDAALFPKNIDTAVYHSLIDAVHDGIGALHEYVALRQRTLKGVKEIHLYDMYVPLTPNFDMPMPYKEAEELVIESVAPLGSEYQQQLSDGLKKQRWVDRYENKNKRSGGYSSGCYDSNPYILLNYAGSLRDAFVLAHEAGHSMHSYLSHKHQPYQYGHYPIFLAEVASTFNEELLIRLLLERSRSKEEKIFLITQKIEDIRATLFRQAMFAEFELYLHQMAEQNIPLTPKLLKEKYRDLNRYYFGKDVVIDPEAEVEWARIPHFYYNFYVYQYATGISAALALANRVMNGGKKERDAYLFFLKAGCSDYPIEILQKAGVDMRTPLPVQSAITLFKDLVKQLGQLLAKK